MDLQSLQQIGAVASSLATVSTVGVSTVSIDDVLSLSAREQGELQSVVTVGNPEWIATARKKPPQEAASVFSCSSDGLVGCWKQKEKAFLLMRLNEGRLETTKKYDFKFKEEETMAGLDINATNDATEAMSQFDEMMKGMDATPTAAPTEAESQKTDRAAARAAKQQEIDRIRSSMGSVSLGDTSDLIVNNHKHGRLIAFITKTNNVIKVTKKSRAKVGPDGKRILKADAESKIPDKTKKKLAEGAIKDWPVSYCEREAVLAFTDAKPGKVVGVVIATPVGSEIELTKLQNAKEAFKADESKKDLVYRMLPIETAYSYVAANYGDWIAEDPSVVGEAVAGRVYFKVNYKTENVDGKEVQKMRASFCLNRKDSKRKTLLTANNYFPLKVYQTAPLDGASAETKASFNANIAAALKDGGYDKLCKESQDKLTQNSDGSYKSAWIDNGEKLDIVKFDASTPDEKVLSIELPLRTIGKTKSGDKTTYKYEYIAAGEENGPQTNPVFQKIIKASTFSEEEFLEKAIALGSTRSTGSKSSTPTLTAKDFLSATMSTNIDTGTVKDLAALTELIDAAAAAK